MKLYLIRGLPGSGKSTLAAELATALRAPHFEHDKYLYTPEGEYLWTESRMAYAYRACLRDTEQKMSLSVPAVVVSNVFPTGRSMRNYRKLAEQYGYQIAYVVVENRRGGVNIHSVPEEALAGMRASFQVEL
jgi:predicted kinase